MRRLQARDAIALTVSIGICVALLLALWGGNRFDSDRTDCMNNVRNILGIVEVAMGGGERGPPRGGLLLYLIEKGGTEGFEGEAVSAMLFCPGDTAREGYRSSYATRVPGKKAATGEVLICDATAQNHGCAGIVVGLRGGTVAWREKVRHYGLRPLDSLGAGPDSLIEELRCLVRE